MKPVRFEHTIAFVLAGALTALWILGEQGARGSQMAVGADLVPLGGAGVITLMVVFVVLNALFVASETAINLLRPVHVKLLKEGSEKKSRRIQDIIDSRQRYATACALGSRFTWMASGLLVLVLSLGFGVVQGADGETVFHSGQFFLHLVIIAFPVALVNLVIGDLVPKSYATLHPHGIGLRLHGFIKASSVAFSIPATLLVSVANLVTGFFGGRASFTLPNEAEEEIKSLVDNAEVTGEIETDEKELLHSVFEFTDTVAREVMTPRIDLDALPVNSDPQEIVKVMQESGHTRIPLYEGTDDQILGIIHAKDLLMAMVSRGANVNVRQLLRKAMFVPEGKNLHELLAEMKVSRSHMAIVQDEYGGTAGIVTIEDIVEELVGDIVDEYDNEEPEIVPESEGEFLIDGKAHLDDLNRQIGAHFQSEEFDTLGGYVFGLFGRQPKLGDSIEDGEFVFLVTKTDGRRIQQLRLQKQVSEPELEEVD